MRVFRSDKLRSALRKVRLLLILFIGAMMSLFALLLPFEEPTVAHDFKDGLVLFSFAFIFSLVACRLERFIRRLGARHNPKLLDEVATSEFSFRAFGSILLAMGFFFLIRWTWDGPDALFASYIAASVGGGLLLGTIRIRQCHFPVNHHLGRTSRRMQ